MNKSLSHTNLQAIFCYQNKTIKKYTGSANFLQLLIQVCRCTSIPNFKINPFFFFYFLFGEIHAWCQFPPWSFNIKPRRYILWYFHKLLRAKYPLSRLTFFSNLYILVRCGNILKFMALRLL